MRSMCRVGVIALFALAGLGTLAPAFAGEVALPPAGAAPAALCPAPAPWAAGPDLSAQPARQMEIIFLPTLANGPTVIPFKWAAGGYETCACYIQSCQGQAPCYCSGSDGCCGGCCGGAYDSVCR